MRPNCIGYRWTRHCCARSTGSPCGTTPPGSQSSTPRSQSPLSRSGAGRDIIVGTPVAGRSDGDVVGLVGMFVSMVALRSDGSQRGFGDLVVRSRETILDGLDHSAVDVEEVIDHLRIGRDGSRHPLIAVTLTVDADGIR